MFYKSILLKTSIKCALCAIGTQNSRSLFQRTEIHRSDHIMFTYYLFDIYICEIMCLNIYIYVKLYVYNNI